MADNVTDNVKIEFEGKTYDTGIEKLVIGRIYVVNIKGYSIYIVTSKERPEICESFYYIKNVIDKMVEK